MKIDETTHKHQIMDLCNGFIGPEDTVVGALRYGAHIPHLYQSACLEGSLEPKQIHLLLGHMISFFPQEFYRNRNFVILDDTVYTGHELARLKTILVKVHGVPTERIRTATLVVHEGSPYDPDYPKEGSRLPDAEYIAWKEILGSLVSQDIRPTERDHPLYFFEATNIKVGKFLEILRNCGQLHSVGSWNSHTLKVSLTISSANLCEIMDLAGVQLGSTYKLRIYWRQDSDRARFTVVPMGFPTINLKEFINSKSSRTLAGLVGLRTDFFEDVHESFHPSSRDSALFYFASRSIAAILLELVLKHASPRLNYYDFNLQLLSPALVDGAVDYVFPATYHEFYGSVFQQLETIMSSKSTYAMLPLMDEWKRPPRSTGRLRRDPLLQNPYEILAFLAQENDPAMWDGRRWIPDFLNLERGKTFQQLAAEFGDPIFLSKSLDDLLEAGLLRAKDMATAEGGGRYCRTFLPGGEYNAIQVSRLAEILAYKPEFVPNAAIAEDEAIELWGPH